MDFLFSLNIKTQLKNSKDYELKVEGKFKITKEHVPKNMHTLLHTVHRICTPFTHSA